MLCLVLILMIANTGSSRMFTSLTSGWTKAQEFKIYVVMPLLFVSLPLLFQHLLKWIDLLAAALKWQLLVLYSAFPICMYCIQHFPFVCIVFGISHLLVLYSAFPICLYCIRHLYETDVATSMHIGFIFQG